MRYAPAAEVDPDVRVATAAVHKDQVANLWGMHRLAKAGLLGGGPRQLIPQSGKELLHKAGAVHTPAAATAIAVRGSDPALDLLQEPILERGSCISVSRLSCPMSEDGGALAAEQRQHKRSRENLPWLQHAHQLRRGCPEADSATLCARLLWVKVGVERVGTRTR
jgi:hypothetical protein